MIVLDTNVVSELMRPLPASEVVEWVDGWASEDVLLTAVTAADLRYGVLRLPPGRRARDLRERVDALLAEDFQGRILPFDAQVALHYAEVVVARERSGRPIAMADAQIAATCRAWGARLATRNVADFVGTGIAVVDPWRPTDR